MTKTVKVTLDMPEVEGYEYTGEYRQALATEMYMGGGRALKGSTISEWPILRKADSWRSATVEDAIRALQGIHIEARFWNAHCEVRKTYGILSSCIPTSAYPWIRVAESTAEYQFCEVKE
jgi:hypothetical protein